MSNGLHHNCITGKTSPVEISREGKMLHYLKHHIGEIQSYSDVQWRFTDNLRQFTIHKDLTDIEYVEEFGREVYEITIRKLSK